MTARRAGIFDIKICGLTTQEDALRAAELGATALGFIFATGAASRRQVSPEFVRTLNHVKTSISKIGVFQNQSLEEVIQTSSDAQIDGIQLHGQESPPWIQELRRRSPLKLFIKALDVTPKLTAKTIAAYASTVDVILFDAPRIQTHPHRESPNLDPSSNQSSNTNPISRVLDVDRLETLLRAAANDLGRLPKFWVAGGLNAENVATTILRIHPDGVDVASGVESGVVINDSPLKKDPELMARFVHAAQGAADAT